ncbi:type II toxin-antitoxin system mRNA interferase toxin, RelE/StbE family [Candidatus Azambacteria bacterium]|nr:type II toxin-antitoxin system mRNA interferase toxin, RelE/StbE family [Candidatus Azambacteria bacterium]MBI3685133.1 type II toxin-antitoxin system mRNA interferase toxin, RelE/StbE family [Candidatus Azambacteria bacterium]
MLIRTSSRFEKRYQKLPAHIKERAKEREQLFRVSPFHPLLRTHKLSGKEKEHWAFWITHFYRIKFIFLADEEVLFLDVGTHDEVYR